MGREDLSRSVKFEVADAPPSANGFFGKTGRNWDYNREKMRWDQLVRAALRGKAPKKPIQSAVVSIHYTFPDNRRRDPDNYAGKMIMDPVVACGVLPDDSFRHVRKLEISAEVRPGVTRTAVTIEEVV